MMFAGGSLPPKLGDKLVAAGVRLHSIYGGTEIGSPTRFAPMKVYEENWISKLTSFQRWK
ncbi:hypothetical protein C0991_000315 [Blastosporella zonata]|nr:hypothetical protein C0991_000315 [Blastosporella zonata]